jgi:hypothetical protein
MDEFIANFLVMAVAAVGLGNLKTKQIKFE